VKFIVVVGLPRGYSRDVATNKNFLAFRVSPELRREILEIADGEARSISQVCELLLSEGVEAYKKEGAKFIQRLVAKQLVAKQKDRSK
jgi:hypothetical protein